MIFNYNREKIPADSFPTFPAFNSERAHIHKGRLSAEDFQTIMTRLENPTLFWFKSLLTLAFKYGFRRGELLNAKVRYFDSETSKFTLPAFTTKNKESREVTILRDGEIYKMLVKLTDTREPDAPLFVRKGGKPVRDYRKTWDKMTKGVSNGNGGRVTIHDLRRSAITGMVNKGIGADKAGTHLTGDVFRRYVSLSEKEKQETAAAIEG
jgi:integrase